MRTSRRGRGVLVAAALVVTAACSAAPRPGTELAAGDRRDGDAIEVGESPAGIDVDGDGVADTAPDGSPLPPTVGAGGQPPAPGTPGAPGVTATTTPGAPPPGPAPPSAFVSTLFTDKEDRVGISDTEIRMCAHAALIFGAAFNTSDDDLNVYWSAVNDTPGKLHNRKVTVTYKDDQYSSDRAVTAAEACAEENIFMLLGGIGFDQIPAVREWAEKHRMLYFHHTATVNGSEGKQFSYTGLPTTEKMGELFAELAVAKFPGKKVAIIKRESPNWEPGVTAFKQVAKKHGIDFWERGVLANKRHYLQDIQDAKASGAEVVWLWLNALESTEFIKQSKAQDWHPHFMVFPFNLTSQTLGADALNPPVTGVAMFNAYSKGDYSGEFARYADDMKQFEQQYAKYRPNVDLGGVGGDLLFLNWSAQKAMHQLLVQCGRDCSRNRFLELLHGYKANTNTSACELDFTRAGPGDDHRGGWQVSVMETYRSPSGKVNFRNIATCVEHLI